MKPSILLCIVILLCACGRNEPVPTDHYYRLTMPQVENSAHLTGESLHIGEFIAEGVFNERSLLFTIDENARVLKQYHYHFWVTSPPRMLRDIMVDYLRACNVAPTVIPESRMHHNSLRITGRLLDFEEVRLNEQITSRVRIELRVDEAASDVPLMLKEYSASVPVNGDSVRDIVAAYDEALHRIYPAFKSDLGGVLSP